MGANANRPKKNEYYGMYETPLQGALSNRHAEIFKNVLQSPGIIISNSLDNMLRKVVSRGHEEVAQILMEMGATR
jgi:hypothetical protein